MPEYGIINVGAVYECVSGDKAVIFLSLEEAAEWVASL